MTEEAQREIRDQATQISRPRIEGAESSRPSRETTNLEQPGPRIFTAAPSNPTSAAPPTVRLTAATSMRMSPPTTAAQPHWTTPTRPTPKGKELENKPVKDQPAKYFQEKDMRNHWSGYNDEDDDHLKLGIERIDEEEGQDPNKETGQNDVPNQVSRISNNQVPGVETQHQARDGPNDWHNQFQGKHSQVLGVELQSPTTKGLHNLVPGVESQTSTVQGSGSGESRDQPPCCLTHSYKSNIVFTERLLLRNSSKDQDNTERLWLRNSSKDQDKPGKEFNKTVRILEVMNWWRAVFELSVLTTAFHVSMGLGFLYNPIRKLQQQIGFHNKSPKSLKSPQASLGQRVQQQAGEENKKDTCEKPRDTGRVSWAQLARWIRFLKQVEDAGTTATIHIIGDLNLDFLKWQVPDRAHSDMVNCTKNILESNGFTQLVRGATRSWPGQLDSLIDHLWSNDHSRVMSCVNEVEAVGDHNCITGHIRITGRYSKRLDTRRRNFKTFDPVKYRERLAEVNWTEIYGINDVDIANDFLETKLKPILNELCPMSTVQYCSNHKPWLTSRVNG